MSRSIYLEDNFADIEKFLNNYPDEANEVVNDVLRKEAPYIFERKIKAFMPVSDKEKGTHAKHSKSIKSVNDILEVKMRTEREYGYLYFPDDGSTTVKHRGNKQFFFRGVSSEADTVSMIILNRLIKKFNK